MSKNDATLAYYASHAADYARQTVGLDTAATREYLLQRLAPGAHILDAGCGSGRDSQAFKAAGFRVTAFDGCPEMAAEASALLQQPVQTLLLQDVAFSACFDAVWANASLLHLETPELEAALQRLFVALKPTGLLFASFKVGDAEHLDSAGRFFNDMTPERAESLITCAGGQLVAHRLAGDVMGRDTQWLHLLARRSG